MGFQARRFVWTVLGIHLALFVGVLLIVYYASHRIYASVRADAIDSARQTQDLLGKQIAAGIAAYYESTTKVLELLRPLQVDDGAVASTQPLIPPDVPTPLLRRGTLRERIGDSLWAQLQDRVTLLFAMDRPGLPRIYPIGGTDQLMPVEALSKAGQWLSAVTAPSISPIIRLNGNAGNLVAVPISGPGRLLVAFVPLARLDQMVLSDVNRRAALGGVIYDSDGTILCSSVPELLGKNLFKHARDPRISEASMRITQAGLADSALFDTPFTYHDQVFSPAILTYVPVKMLGTTWWLAIGSTLDSVDEGIDSIFHEATRWALFVVVSITAILVSTSVQLIRGRMRLERLTHNMLTRELREARHIQLAWLPDDGDRIPSLDIAAVNHPASHISGDFYNWFSLADGRVTLLIGDVTGHGMSAAFLMSTTQLLIRSTMQRVGDPGACLDEVNRQLCGQLFNGQFVTILIVVLDIEHGHFDIASAGHPLPLMSEGNAYQALDVDSQLAVGISDDMTFTTSRLPLPPEAAFLLYTDGAIEIMGSTGDQYDVAGLQSSLPPAGTSSHRVIEEVVRAVNRYRHGQPLADDLTLVAIQLVSATVGSRELVDSTIQ